MRGKELLTSDQRKMFMSIPDDINEQGIEMHYTITLEDLGFIKKLRRDQTIFAKGLPYSSLSFDI